MSIVHYCMQQHELRPLTKSLSFAAAKEGQKGEHSYAHYACANRACWGQLHSSNLAVGSQSRWCSPCDLGAPAGRTNMCTVTTVSGLGSPMAGRRSEQHKQFVRSPAQTSSASGDQNWLSWAGCTVADKHAIAAQPSWVQLSPVGTAQIRSEWPVCTCSKSS